MDEKNITDSPAEVRRGAILHARLVTLHLQERAVDTSVVHELRFGVGDIEEGVGTRGREGDSTCYERIVLK